MKRTEPENRASSRTLTKAEGTAPPRAAQDRLPSPSPASLGLIAICPSMRRVVDTVLELAESDLPVVIEGESGTGKELVASAIHRLGRRAAAPFVTENCGAIPDSLVEAELFGHERGAFTGATFSRPGLVERAHRGTLFLDEVTEMNLEHQTKFLRVLQERKVRRIGARRARPVDFRLVSASNRLLEAQVALGRFREDLYYRLRVVALNLPPLRERREDIPHLVEHFNVTLARELDRKPLRFTPGAIETLTDSPWPGNIRQLRNEVWRLAASKADTVRAEHLSASIRSAGHGKPEPWGVPRAWPAASLEEIEREFVGGAIRDALRVTAGNVTRAARRLGVARSSLYRRLKRYSISPEEFSPPNSPRSGPGPG